VIASTDVANPYGSLVPWPKSNGEARPQRAVGTKVFLGNGRLLGWLGKGEDSLVTFACDDDKDRAEAFGALVACASRWLRSTGRAAWVLASVDGKPASSSTHASDLVRAGFVVKGASLVLDAPREPFAEETREFATRPSRMRGAPSRLRGGAATQRRR
jgi:ATP-dependent Lhr-like helicase